MIKLTGYNYFYDGWLAAHLDLPSPEHSDAQEGYKMYKETFTPTGNHVIDDMRRGNLHACFLEEINREHILVTYEP